MTDPKVILRAGQSGPVVKGTEGNVLTIAPGSTVQPEPASGGSVAAPIQNVFFLDPSFAGTSNGSIAAPFTTVGEFVAEVVDDNAGYKLTLPGVGFTVDEGIPDLNKSSAIVLEGVGRNATFVTGLSFATQTGAPTFEVSEMTLVGGTSLGGGSVDFFFENCQIESFTAPGTLSGTVHLTNCSVSGNVALGDAAPNILASDCIFSGDFACDSGEFDNCTFGSGATLAFGAHVIRFTSCVFQGGTTISNDSDPVIELDPSSYFWFIANGVTFAGDIRLTPVTPIVGAVSKTAPGSVAGGSTTTIDMGDPVGTPKAEAGSDIVGSFGADPGNIAFKIQGLSVDGSTGHVIALIGNNSGATHALADPLLINIVYRPREQAI